MQKKNAIVPTDQKTGVVDGCIVGASIVWVFLIYFDLFFTIWVPRCKATK